MRLDHIAYRVKDRYKTAAFFEKAFGYTIGTEFSIDFDDGTKADCMALLPSEDRHPATTEWDIMLADAPDANDGGRASTSVGVKDVEFHAYHAPPEVFISDGKPGSIVGDWVLERGGIGGIHHMAYQVEDVAAVMKRWRDEGHAEFYSEEPIICKEPDLTQVFTKPSELTGVIYEFINREGAGFCKDSVKSLMESTKK